MFWADGTTKSRKMFNIKWKLLDRQMGIFRSGYSPIMPVMTFMGTESQCAGDMHQLRMELLRDMTLDEQGEQRIHFYPNDEDPAFAFTLTFNSLIGDNAYLHKEVGLTGGTAPYSVRDVYCNTEKGVYLFFLDIKLSFLPRFRT